MKNTTAILLLFLANTISGIAQGISMLAIPWYFAQTNDMGRFGWVYGLTTAAAIFWVPYSGTLVDRYNRRRIFQVITAVCGLLVLTIAGLGYAWQGLPWYLVASVFAITFLNYNIHYPCLYAFVQEIVEPPYYSKMTSYLEIQGQLATMLAGAAGAILLEGTQNGKLLLFGFDVPVSFELEVWHIYDIFLLDGSTYLAAFIILSIIRYTPIIDRYWEKGNLRQQLHIGWEYLRSHPYIFIFGVASYAIFVAALLEGFYLSAQYVKQHLEVSGAVYAASAMYYSIGALIAGAAIQRLFRGLTAPQAVIGMTWATSALFFALAFSCSVVIFYTMLFVLGLTNAGTRVMRTTFLFKNIPNQVYGRTNSIFFLSNVLFRILFIGIFALPFFHHANNVIYTFAILGIFLVVAALVLGYFSPLIVNKNQSNTFLK